MIGGSNTIKIFFPGRRYSVDRSYLYYLDKYIDGDSVYLNYNSPRDSVDLLPINEEIEKDYKFALEKLSKIDFTQYGEIIFIGKSVGTVIAGMIREHLKLDRARFICLTPINEAVKYLEQTDFIVTSEADEYIDLKSTLTEHQRYPFLTIYKDLPHSLEYKYNIFKTIDILKTTLDQALNYLDTSYKDLLN